MKRVLGFFMIVMLFPMSGYARVVEPVRALEGDISIPYTPIGTLEVKKKVNSLGVKTLQILTLGAYQPFSAANYRQTLKDMLAKKAGKFYGANAVIHVHYWPDPESGSFPKGTIYARGEMVRYTPFPAES